MNSAKLQLKSRKLKTKPARILFRLVDSFFRYQVTRTAAQMSYYLTFSVFPMLLFTIGVISLLHLDVNSVTNALQGFSVIFGNNIDVLIEYASYVITNESPGLLWAGISMAVVASSAAFRGLMSITGEIAGRPTFKSIATVGVSLIMSLVLLFTIFGFLLATLTGRWFLNILVERLHLTALALAWRWLRFPVTFALGILALTAIYRVSLSKKALPNSKAWPGAVCASVALVIATGIFSEFIGMSSKYSLIYGSLTGIIILLLWFFLCSNILVMGNILNCVLAKDALGENQPTLTFHLPKHIQPPPKGQ